MRRESPLRSRIGSTRPRRGSTRCGAPRGSGSPTPAGGQCGSGPIRSTRTGASRSHPRSVQRGEERPPGRHRTRHLGGGVSGRVRTPRRTAPQRQGSALRIQKVSDLHLEFDNPVPALTDGADIVMCAGDRAPVVTRDVRRAGKVWADARALMIGEALAAEPALECSVRPAGGGRFAGVGAGARGVLRVARHLCGERRGGGGGRAGARRRARA